MYNLEIVPDKILYHHIKYIDIEWKILIKWIISVNQVLLKSFYMQYSRLNLHVFIKHLNVCSIKQKEYCLSFLPRILFCISN